MFGGGCQVPSQGEQVGPSFLLPCLAGGPSRSSAPELRAQLGCLSPACSPALSFPPLFIPVMVTGYSCQQTYLRISHQKSKGTAQLPGPVPGEGMQRWRGPWPRTQGHTAWRCLRSEWGGSLSAKWQLEQGCLCALLTFMCHLILTTARNAGGTGIIMPILWMTKSRFKEVKRLAPGLDD